MDEILKVDRLGKWFGGLEALHEVELTVREGRDLRPDRPQRVREDDAPQPDQRHLHPFGGRDQVSGRADQRPDAASDHPQGHRAYLPDDPALSGDAGERQRHGGPPLSDPGRHLQRRLPDRSDENRGTRDRGAGPRGAPFPGAGRRRVQSRSEPSLRGPAAARAGQGPGDQPGPASPRRAGRRHERGGDEGAHRLHREDPGAGGSAFCWWSTT